MEPPVLTREEGGGDSLTPEPALGGVSESSDPEIQPEAEEGTGMELFRLPGYRCWWQVMTRVPQTENPVPANMADRIKNLSAKWKFYRPARIFYWTSPYELNYIVWLKKIICSNKTFSLKTRETTIEKNNLQGREWQWSTIYVLSILSVNVSIILKWLQYPCAWQFS